MKLAAAYGLASLISDSDLSPDYIIPAPFDPRVGDRLQASPRPPATAASPGSNHPMRKAPARAGGALRMLTGSAGFVYSETRNERIEAAMKTILECLRDNRSSPPSIRTRGWKRR
jgi:hypothetical protein